jgi:hypothetical protein
VVADPDVRFSPWAAVSRMPTTQASGDRRLRGTGGAAAAKGVNPLIEAGGPPASGLDYRGA